MSDQADVRNPLVDQLSGEHAHPGFEQAVKNLSFSEAGRRPESLPYSVWEQVEHIRISQWDIVEFSRNPDHVSPKWPEGYWPEHPAPPDEKTWKETKKKIRDDLQAMIEMVKDPANDLFQPFPWGDGQTLFREAVLIIDHNAYHTGQIVIIRRLLGNWQG